MQYSIPDHLKTEYGVPTAKNRRWTPPPTCPLVQ